MACSPNAEVQHQLEVAEQELAEVKEALEKAHGQIEVLKMEEEDDEEAIIHTVYFKVKPGLSEEEINTFIAEVKKMEEIEVVKDLEVGTFLDVGDDRALSDYGIVMQVGFASEKDMAAYQEHPIHLGLKEKLGSWLAGPPAVHDFEIR